MKARVKSQENNVNLSKKRLNMRESCKAKGVLKEETSPHLKPFKFEWVPENDRRFVRRFERNRKKANARSEAPAGFPFNFE
jgi:hypothetical protein